ncbi:MAG: nucleotide exchange factor GrpE [Saprospiraceae bacterium]|nr:nucleotide exchange factor GrpE [Saprospiraceae bacterium]
MGDKDKKTNLSEDQLEDISVESSGEEKGEKPSKTKASKKSKDSKGKELAEAQMEIAELKDKYLRLLAEFENFKKRNLREKLETMQTAAKDTMAAILPVLDDFDRAKKTAEDENTEEQFSEGVTLVYGKMYRILEGLGLKAMEWEGQDFDPELHEALTEIPAPTPELKGKIVDAIEKGYYLNDKIIRHAKVVVGK